MTTAQPATMHAAVFRPQGRVEVQDVPVPRRQPGGVLLRVRACGICGSDLHTLRADGTMPSFWLGHEIAAEVVEAEAGLPVQPGDPVAVEPVVACGQCRYCESGHYAHCPTLQVVGADLPGGYAEYLQLPSARHLHRLPPDLPWELGALVEPLAVGVHALRQAGFTYGQSVVVVGGGTIGQLALQAARAMGARRTGLLATHPHQAALAARSGATAVGMRTDDQAPARLADELGGPVDIVVEAVGGHSSAVQDALSLVRPLGTLLLTGLFTAPVRIDAATLMFNEVRVLGSFGYGAAQGQQRDFALALELLSGGAVDGRAVVTHRYPLTEAPAAFATALDKTSGVIKATLLC